MRIKYQINTDVDGWQLMRPNIQPYPVDFPFSLKEFVGRGACTLGGTYNCAYAKMHISQ